MASTLHDPAPPAAAPAPATPPTVVADPLGRLGPRGRAVWAVVILALAVVPALVSAARSETVQSDVLLEPVAGASARDGAMAAYARRVLALPVVQGRIASQRNRYWFLIGLRHVDVDVRAEGPGGERVRLSVADRTPGKARDLAHSVARQLVAQSRGAAARRSSTRAGLRVVDRALQDPALTAARRAQLESQRRFIVVQGRQDEGVVELRIARPATLPAGDRIARAVSKVAPEGVPRPNPLWAGFAGLLLGLALCALWLALPAGRRASGPAPPGE